MGSTGRGIPVFLAAVSREDLGGAKAALDESRQAYKEIIGESPVYDRYADSLLNWASADIEYRQYHRIAV
ncbi:MAG: hypothetical protein ACREQV_21535 [Candidatus Binatia bacterium]